MFAEMPGSRSLDFIRRAECPERVEDRDRGTPHGATPPTPPGVRVAYHGGSTGLSLDGGMKPGETEGVEIVVAQGVLDRRVS